MSKETMLQMFQWYSPNDGRFWDHTAEAAQTLKRIGYTHVWMPPAYKGHQGINDVGYGVYDLYDLGEFNQKGSVRTKYGTLEQYQHALKILHENGIKVISDIVLNQRMGADEKETVKVHTVNPYNRDQSTGDQYETEVWTKFTFPGRKGKYSDFIWNWTCFTGTDYDARYNSNQIMLFADKHWDEKVSHEQGNFDYIMGDDVDVNDPYVKEELYRWGKWYQEMTGSDGYRLDAIKSLDFDFFEDWLKMMNETGDHKEPFAVGEYWSGNENEIEQYLEDCHYTMRLFDVVLHYRLMNVSNSNGQFDIRNLFSDTLSKNRPDHAVAFVDNHDTQPGQALQSFVGDWFKQHAYASILLYQSKMPCVFIGDIAGISQTGTPAVPGLNEMVWIRSNCLSDWVVDLFDEDTQKAAWIALGEHPVVVLYTIGQGKDKEIQFADLAGRTFIDVLHPEKKTQADENGKVYFTVDEGACSIWIDLSDYERMNQELGQEKRNDEQRLGSLAN